MAGSKEFYTMIGGKKQDAGLHAELLGAEDIASLSTGATTQLSDLELQDESDKREIKRLAELVAGKYPTLVPKRKKV